MISDTKLNVLGVGLLVRDAKDDGVVGVGMSKGVTLGWGNGPFGGIG